MLSKKMSRRLSPVVARVFSCAFLFSLLACFAPVPETYAKKKEPAAYGRIEVSTKPGNYPILVDGQPTGETSGAVRLIELPPGAHTVEIQFPNGTRWVRAFNVRAGRRECIALNYRPRVVSIPRRLKSPCPYPVNVSAPATVADGDTITYSADVDYQGTAGLRYNWTVTPAAARIISGADTATITVDSTGLGNQRVTAVLTVDDGSGDRNCRQAAQATTSVLVPPAPPLEPRRFDEFPSVAFDDDKARLDNFAIELQRNPGAIGHVIVYGGRRDRAGHADMLGERTRNYLVRTRGIDAGRVQIVNGGYRERAAYELWLVPQGATPPPPKPSVPPDQVRPATTPRSRRRL
ncbi:MAG TPA: hypothetical protein VM943_07960 [Pyrinomonadaceae bacterium]|nr:hypothetical protein [Pyrinomonadaceae bacterium]